jgi:hypothetical protein
MGQVTDAISLMINAIGGLLNSASKLVFLMIAATVCTGFLTNHLETKDFMTVVMIVFTYYFTRSQFSNPGGGNGRK